MIMSNINYWISRFLLTLCSFIFLSLASAQSVSYSLITVSSPGNSADSITGFGSVSYAYKIGLYEVTVANYTAFLNAVAKTDTYGLWVNSMQAATNIAGITRSGSPGAYFYTAMSGKSGAQSYSSGGTPPFKTLGGQDSSNCPITWVTWFNAARFANWMANGQPVGSQNSATTEDGAYPINGAMSSGSAPARNLVNPNTGNAPTYFIPTENEWYKAAYYDPNLNQGRGGYYKYATKSNVTPGNITPTSGYSSSQPSTNQVNYIYMPGGLYTTTQAPLLSITEFYLTPVGTFTSVTSPWGAYDMTGSVWEFNTPSNSSSAIVGLRGGAWTSLDLNLMSNYYLGIVPYSTALNLGFRLAAPITTP